MSVNNHQAGSDNEGKAFKAVEEMRPRAMGMVAQGWGTELDLPEVVEQLCRESGLEKVFGGITDQR